MRPTELRELDSRPNDLVEAAWKPVRELLGISAFGVNGYVARAAGDRLIEDHSEEGSGFDTAKPWKGEPPDVVYNAAIPPEFFDFVIVDECHRSIYET